MIHITLCLCIAMALCSCYRIRPSKGGGQTTFTPPRTINVDDIALPDGYIIEPVLEGLTFPTAVIHDEQDRLYLLEGGYSYGEVFGKSRLSRVEKDGKLTPIAEGDNPPWTGMSYRDGAFYISEGGSPGRVLKITMDGTKTVLADNLPGMADHHLNRAVIGNDGFVYFTQGSITNSGVVGEDSHKFGWLERRPEMHEIPGADIKLTSQNFTTKNPLTPEDDTVTTGAYLPFGTASEDGQVIPGTPVCTGSVLRVPAAGGPVEMYAWGLRNPFGLAFAPDGQLFTTENGMDVRGSRPVYGAADYLYRVEQGKWYGFPDFTGGTPLTDPRFADNGIVQPRFLLAEHPNTPPQPVARLACYSSSCGLDFSTNPSFGHVGEAFIAQFGDMAPGVGKVLHPVGYKVVRVDITNGVVHDFVVNKGRENAPASFLKHGGIERPVDARFSRDGAALYVVDFGVMTCAEEGPTPYEGTGVLWRISKLPVAVP